MKLIPTPTLHMLRGLIIVFLAVAWAHGEAPKSEKKGTSAYAADEVGWKTVIPSDWKALTAEEQAKINATGQKALEKAAGGAVDITGLKELLSLRKDQFNIFLSTIEPFNEATDGPYPEAQKKVLEVILEAYKAAGLKTSKVTSGKENVDDLEFFTVEWELLHPTTGAVVLRQKMFSRLLNGFDFSMTLSSNNEKDRKVLQGIVVSSKFSKRN